MANLPQHFWDGERERLLAIIAPKLEQMSIMGADRTAEMLNALGLGFDPALAHEQAVAWARQHTDSLLRDLEVTTKGSVGQVVAAWIESGADRAALEQQLMQILDGNSLRASIIGVTETTRAFSQGEAVAYAQAGLPPLAYKPPAHPGCYCWYAPVRLPNGEWVIVWQTNKQENTCQRSLETPWGRVNGCRDLQDRCISEGPYLGMTLSEARAAAK